MKHVIQCIVYMLFFVLKLSRDLHFLHTVSSLHSVTTIILYFRYIFIHIYTYYNLQCKTN